MYKFGAFVMFIRTIVCQLFGSISLWVSYLGLFKTIFWGGRGRGERKGEAEWSIKKQ